MPKIREKGRLMSASEIERTLVRLAHEIVEKHDGCDNIGLVGIKRRGVPLAERLGALISKIEKRPVDTGDPRHQLLPRRSFDRRTAPNRGSL